MCWGIDFVVVDFTLLTLFHNFIEYIGLCHIFTKSMFLWPVLKLVLQYYGSLHKQLQRYMTNSCSNLWKKNGLSLPNFDWIGSWETEDHSSGTLQAQDSGCNYSSKNSYHLYTFHLYTWFGFRAEKFGIHSEDPYYKCLLRLSFLAGASRWCTCWSFLGISAD